MPMYMPLMRSKVVRIDTKFECVHTSVAESGYTELDMLLQVEDMRFSLSKFCVLNETHVRGVQFVLSSASRVFWGTPSLKTHNKASST
jgi:hypothetical protein